MYKIVENNRKHDDIRPPKSVCIKQSSNEEFKITEIEIHPSKKGAAAGVAAGTLVGSVLGPTGAAVGAIIGGITGFILGPDDKKNDK